jgi:hypothetical protein
VTRRWLTPTLVVAALVLGGLLDALLPARVGGAPPAPAQALAAGLSTCAALDTAGGASASALTVAGEVPPSLSGQEATAALVTEQAGEVFARATVPVVGGPVATAVAGDLAEPLVRLRWRAAPVVLSRTWQRPAVGATPGGLVEGACPAAAGDRWYVAGVATAGGALAELHLANPFDGTATVQVRFTTPSGPVEPTRLRNVVVPARGTAVLDLGTFAPEEPDLGVVVDVVAGRIVVEAVQVLQPAIGGVSGTSLVTAAREAAAVWTVPWVEVDDVSTSWLWVTNPGDAAADVRLVVHTPSGPTVPSDAGLLVAPGTTRRIDLSQVVPAEGPVAVTLRSTTDAPVLVSGAVVRQGEDPARSGISVVSAVAPASGPVVALGSGGPGRRAVLRLVNPAAEQATVDVEVLVGSGAVDLPGLSGLVVPAGGTLLVALGDAVAEPHAVVVRPRTGEVVAVLVSSSAEGDLDLAAAVAVPFPSLLATTPLPSRPDGTLLNRTGTTQGVVGSDPAPVDGGIDGTGTDEGGDVGVDDVLPGDDQSGG